MELTGMRVDNKVLMDMKEEILIKIELLKKEIFTGNSSIEIIIL